MKPLFTVTAPAKLNLHLDITGTRPDGFHTLVSIFHGIDLGDELRFHGDPRGTGTKVIGEFDCLPEENLIVKAADLINKTLGRSETFSIEAVKRIPAGAGLGGGSSDAAAVLRGLNRFYGEPLSRKDLQQLGSRLGSDVPFFLGESTAALVTGRGEILRDLPPLKGFQVILLVPPVHIGTPEAYRMFDREGGISGLISEEEVLRFYGALHASPWPFYNSFSRTLVSGYAEIRDALDILERWEPLYRGISGSGSSVFAVFSEDFSIEGPLNEIKSRFDRVWKIKLLARWISPY